MRYKDFFHAKDAIHCRDGQLRSRRSFFIKAKGFDLLPGPNGPERPNSVHTKQSLDVSSIRKLIDQMTRFVPNPAYRPGPRFRLVIFLLGAALAFSALTHPSPAFGAPPPPLPAAGDTKAGASKENLRALIEKIESPEQRTAFLADLRLLLETLETKKKGTGSGSSSINHIYAGLIQRLDDILIQRFQAFRGLPQKLGRVAEKWRNVSGESSLLWGMARFLVAIFLALIFLVAVRRVIRNYFPPAKQGNGASLTDCIGEAIRNWIERVLPSAVLLLAGSMIVILFGLGRIEEGLLLIFVWSIFLERVTTGIIRAIFAPLRPGFRIFPVSDETSGLISVWGPRFVMVAVWGEAIAQGSEVLTLGPEAVIALTNIYRLVILLQALSLVLQYRDGVRSLLSASEPGDAGRTVKTAIAAWNILVSRWHFIAVPYLIVFFMLWATESRDVVRFLISATGMTALIIAATYIIVRLIHLAASRLYSVGDRLKAVVPGIERRSNRYTPLITRSLSGVIWAMAFLFVLDAWGLPTIEVLFSVAGVKFITSVGEIVITIGISILFIEGMHVTVEYFLNGRKDEADNIIEATPHQRTLLPLGFSAFKWVTIVVAGILVLDSLGVNIAPVLAGAGILGLAIGFGAQSLVKDIITGVFMLIENNIAIGDIVRVKDIGGVVESFNLRSVRLRDYNGNVHVIPNSSIDVVTNFTKDFSRAVFDIGVAYREDVDRVIGVIRQVADEMSGDPEWGEQILEPVEIAGVERFDDSAVIIRGRFKTKPIKQWGIRREFNRRIKKAFDENEIEIPFPYRTLNWAEKSPEHPEGSLRPPAPPRPSVGVDIDSGGDDGE